MYFLQFPQKYLFPDLVCGRIAVRIRMFSSCPNLSIPSVAFIFILYIMQIILNCIIKHISDD
ncbi:hypothetical protein CAP31_11220 [Sulfuriferula sp. AH1]|nr:hypothetical protein CAP31_11220 [Sulfuriferula sp. AH1]